MSVLATEAFAGGAGALSGSWTQQLTDSATLNRDGSGLGGSSAGGNDGAAVWNAVVPPSDQYSQLRIAAGGFKYPTARNSNQTTTTTWNGYLYVTNGSAGTSYIAKRVNGAETIILSLGVATTTNDIIRLEVTGSSPATLKAFKQTGGVGNFVQMGSTTTDSSFTSGSFGLGSDTASAVDDWEGGDFTSSIPVYDRSPLPAVARGVI